jgi:hypothetical protein
MDRHSRVFLAGIQECIEMDARQVHAGMTIFRMFFFLLTTLRIRRYP